LAKENKTPSAVRGKDSPLSTALRLTAIVAVIIVMLSALNYFTKGFIAENEQRKATEAKESLFADASFKELDKSSFPLDGEEYKDVTAIFSVIDGNGRTIGYCIDMKVFGFSSDAMTVCFGIEGENAAMLKGIRIISHSETPGIGTKALETTGDFIPSFTGKTANTVNDISAVSGATLTSDAVKGAAETALAAAKKIAGGVNGGK